MPRIEPAPDATRAVYGIKNIELTRELSVILTEMRNQGLDTPPPPVQEGRLLGNNAEHWCDYHQCRGHHTDNCFRLRFDVEKQILNGKLLQFVPSNKPPSTKAQNRPPPKGKGKEKMGYNPPPLPPGVQLPPGPVKDINVISGGFAPGGSVSNAQDVYATQVGEPTMTGGHPTTRPQEAISFSDTDMDHVTYPHDDALVVTLQIGEHRLRRTLIDGGSSADILFKDALLALGFGLRNLKPANVPLVGLSGATVYSLGSITLPVVFGSGATSLRAPVTFLVVDAPTTYNAIIGRTSLHPLRIVPSTVHQKMKFLTPYGVGEVLGDQHASRSCYVNALRRRNQTMTITSFMVASGSSSRQTPTDNSDKSTRRKRMRKGSFLKLSRHIRRVKKSFHKLHAAKKTPATAGTELPRYISDTEPPANAPSPALQAYRIQLLELIEKLEPETLQEYWERFKWLLQYWSLDLPEDEVISRLARSLIPRESRKLIDAISNGGIRTVQELKAKVKRLSPKLRPDLRHMAFTPLQCSRLQLYNEYIQYVLAPAQSNEQPPAEDEDPTWCVQHRTRYHDTEECLTLRHCIESFIQLGGLCDYIR